MAKDALKLRTLQRGDTVWLTGGHVVVPYAPSGWVIRRFIITDGGDMPYVQIVHESEDDRRTGVFVGQLYGVVPGVDRYDPRRDAGLRVGELSLLPGCVAYMITVSGRLHTLHEAARYTGLRVVRKGRVIFGG